MEWDEGHVSTEPCKRGEWKFNEGEALVHEISFMCPTCFNLHKGYVEMRTIYSTNVKTVDLDLEDIEDILVSHYPDHASTIKLTCNHCKKKKDFIQLDANISNAISLLNKMHLYTQYCCEGHDLSSMPYILFKEDVSDRINTKDWKYWKLTSIADNSNIDGKNNLAMRNDIKLHDYNLNLHLQELEDKVFEMYKEFVEKELK